jgi:hypothetical protein
MPYYRGYGDEDDKVKKNAHLVRMKMDIVYHHQSKF